MSEFAIEINHITKNFRIAATKQTLFRSLKGLLNPGSDSRKVCVLNDISCKLEKGKTLGLIGTNGAGKSTLLRVLAGIYRQDSGSVVCQGSMTGFFNLGIGMQRDLTGRENMYLFAAQFGLTSRTVRARIHEMIEFSGLADFIDAPLRSFSVGMIQRLAMSVIKDVDADIILLDEVLAAADIDFGYKCFNLFKKFKSSGKTMVLATHNLDAIEYFCDSVLVLDHGKVIGFGPAGEMLEYYRNNSSAAGAEYFKIKNYAKP